MVPKIVYPYDKRSKKAGEEEMQHTFITSFGMFYGLFWLRWILRSMFSFCACRKYYIMTYYASMRKEPLQVKSMQVICIGNGVVITIQKEIICM
jgi:hypothetical protein